MDQEKDIELARLILPWIVSGVFCIGGTVLGVLLGWSLGTS